MKTILISIVLTFTLSNFVFAQNQIVEGKNVGETIMQARIPQVEPFVKNVKIDNQKMLEGMVVSDDLNSKINKSKQDLNASNNQIDEPKTQPMIEGRQVTESEYNANIKSNQDHSTFQSKKQIENEVYIRDANAKPIPFPKEEYKRKSNVDKPANPNFPKENYQRKGTE